MRTTNCSVRILRTLELATKSLEPFAAGTLCSWLLLSRSCFHEARPMSTASWICCSFSRTSVLAHIAHDTRGAITNGLVLTVDGTLSTSRTEIIIMVARAAELTLLAEETTPALTNCLLVLVLFTISITTTYGYGCSSAFTTRARSNTR